MKGAVSLGEDIDVTGVGGVGAYVQLPITLHIAHAYGFTLPAFPRVLYDAERVDPKVAVSKTSSNQDSSVERRRE